MVNIRLYVLVQWCSEGGPPGDICISEKMREGVYSMKITTRTFISKLISLKTRPLRSGHVLVSDDLKGFH